MDNIIKIKYPVDSIRVSDTKNKLIYEEIAILEDEKQQYEDYSRKLEILFDDPNINIINKKVKELILLSKENSYVFEFINNNQWILKFVNSYDIKPLTNNINFKIENCKILFPYSAYIDRKTQKVFTKEILVPVWKKREMEYIGELIIWILTDNLNEIEDRLKVIFLDNELLGRNIIINNQWILMFINQLYRVELMEKYNIDYIEFNRSYGCSASKKMAKERIIIPKSLENKYTFMESELVKIMQVSNDKIFNYIKKYSIENKNDNYVLRDNLWILNLINYDEQLEVLENLDIKLKAPTKKVVTIKPIGIDKVESYEVEIKLQQYNEYLRLNNIVIELLASDTINKEIVTKLVNSSNLVLEIWPWLNDYVIDEKKKR